METPYDLAQATPERSARMPSLAALLRASLAHPLLPRLLRFLAVGLVGLGVDAALFSLLYGRGAVAPLARAVSLAGATLITWALNRAVTFAPSGHKALHEAARYALVALTAQGFNYVTFLALLHWTGGHHPLCLLVATAVLTAGFSFTGQSLFAFRRGGLRPFLFRRLFS